MFEIQGKNALVTGSSSGIGEAIIYKLAEHGVNCVITYYSDEQKEQALQVQRNIEKYNVKSFVKQVDITSVPSIHQMFDAIVENLGEVDILVNNAGIAPFYSFFDVTEDIWDKTYETNVRGAFFTIQRAAKSMVRKGYGKIVNIASTASLVVTSPVIPHYISSKGALHQLTKALAIELGAHNINVNSIGPSTVNTEFVRDYLSDPNIFRNEVEANPMKRLGTVEQIGDSVLFLVSKYAEQVNGHLLMVDGGLSVKAPQPTDHLVR